MGLRIESQAEPLPGYRLIERLGGGGFGEVWKAEAPGGLYKAIKFVFGNVEATDEEGARAEQELKALKRVAAVRHPYVLSLERYDIIDGQLMIVMELADKTLWDRFKECRDEGLQGIPRQELLPYMLESAEALDLMNTKYDLQHLDVKPQNIFLIHNHVKVADFGLIKDLQGTLASVTGGVTPVYAAPETFDGQVSRATDQYSLAIVFQELLTGKRPFTGTTARQLVLQHMQAEPDLSPLPPKDRPVVRKALSKDYGDRYKTCREFIETLIARDTAVRNIAPGLQPRQNGELGADSTDLLTSTGALPSLGPASTKGLPTLDGYLEGEVGSFSQPETKPGWGTEPLANWDQRAGPQLQFDDWEVDSDSDIDVEELASQECEDSPVTINAEGVLVPAVVIGVGSCGQTLLRQFRRQLQERFGGLNPTPHIRFLYLDTDAEAIAQATKGGDDALRHSEVIYARLHRASHYLKQKDFSKRIASWLPQKLLYHIPRQQVTAGLRALGRLAFVDQSGSVGKRLKAEIAACRSESALRDGVRKTSLSVASTQPRVIVAAGLGGGTGSGMFIDLAFVARHLLKKLGLAKAEVLGLLLLPRPGKSKPTATAQANVYAALTELHHFGEAETLFTAQYKASHLSPKNSVFRESGPAFQRCLIAPLGGGNGDGAGDAPTEEIKLAANLLFTELCTPLGRTAERIRADEDGEAEKAPPKTIYQIAGARRIASPRKQLLRRTARRLCKTLVNQWMSKDAKHLREGIQQWVAQNWSELELSSDEVILKLQTACKQELGDRAEQVLQNTLQPILAAEGETAPAEDGLPANFNIGHVVAALRQIEQLVGVPEGCPPLCGTGSADPASTGRIWEILKAASAAVNRQCDKRIAELVVRLIEQPVFRLAGAEETIRQFSAIVQDSLAHQEHLGQELKERAIVMYNRILELLDRVDKLPKNSRTSWSLPFSKRASPGRQELSAELWDLLQKYPKIRFQSLIMQHAGAFYLGMRGLLSDQLREVNFCRQRLHEIAKLFSDDTDGDGKEPGGEEDTGRRDSLGTVLLPAGCNSLEEAVSQCVGQISADDLAALDHKLERVIRRKFRALVNVCLSSANVLDKAVPVLEAAAQDFLKERIADDDVVQTYLREQDDEDDDKLPNSLLDFYAEASPGLDAPPMKKELCLLALPESPDRQILEDAARQAFERTDLHITGAEEEILLCRVTEYRSPAEIEQVGKESKQAYDRLCDHESFTPHSRADIPHWTALEVDTE